MNSALTPEVLKGSLSFQEYQKLAEDIVSEKIPRSGMYADDNMFHYTAANLKRINRVLEFMVVQQKAYNALSALKDEWLWVVLTEPWCGDASWGVPTLYLLSKCTDKIEFRILLRDSNKQVMANYLTNGGEAIPKMVCLRQKDGAELGTWGPRPAPLQHLVSEFKKSANYNLRDNIKMVNEWYENDNTKTTQEELILQIKQWSERA